jgi:ketopantoate hydroxymethyltransferase
MVSRNALIHPAIARQCTWRYESPAHLGLKVNLYRDSEVMGLARALTHNDLRGAPLESVMVGDSYFMTHLGRPSTRLVDADERRWGLETLTALVAEVRSAINAYLPEERLPYLIGDIPDGSASDPDVMLRAAELFLAAGANAIKLEAGTSEAMICLEAAVHRNIPSILHLGYTPQTGSLARYGNTTYQAFQIFSAARRARDAGASAIVLEMVSEPVNQALSAPNRASIPIYSIFSGRAPFGGQSLNVWDATFRPKAPRRFFPPTAILDPDEDRETYTPDLVADCMERLIRLTLNGAFPVTPSTRMSYAEQQALLEIDPWSG